MACRKAKVEFSEEERKELVKAFDNGMNTVSKGRLPLIQDLARRFKKYEKEIKVGCFIKILVLYTSI